MNMKETLTNIQRAVFVGIIMLMVLTIPFVVDAASTKNLAGDKTEGYPLTDALENGVNATQTLSIATGSATKMGTLTAGTKIVEAMCSHDVNYGGAGVPTGTGYTVLAAGSVKTWKVATTTPNIYFIGKTTTSTVTLTEYK